MTDLAQQVSDYQNFIATSRYARWIENENRRENRYETASRYISNIVAPKVTDPDIHDRLYDAITDMAVMPSMRAFMTAGPAANRDNTCIYNCAFMPVDHPRSFDEAMFVLLCGTGVGFSVEASNVSKLPSVPSVITKGGSVTVGDSKEGWASAYRKLVEGLFNGVELSFDVSRVRPAGAKLNTFGGRASGPGPLVELFEFTIDKFRAAAGRQLTPIECHDIMCKIGEVVVVGGVRRSAMISLSDLSDEALSLAKSGEWWVENPQRALANNSVAYTEKPSRRKFNKEWKALIASGSGERGVFNREASINQAMKNGRRDAGYEFGTNPCSEIILRPYQFCNLTEVVCRVDDTVETLTEKVRLATILGTVQSTYTHFPYLRDIWRKNTEAERLLGVSLTGIMDCQIGRAHV